eukprot:13901380-Alexandrium_andersonii.AAC.1
MLGFSPLEAHSKDDREALLRIISSHKMTGYYGNQIWGKRNIAKYMREGGHMLRFAMRVIEELGPTKFSYIDWPNEGVMIGPDWAMA